MLVLIQIINILSQALTIIVVISVILSYFMDPYNPIRRGVDNIVDPLLAPIRRVLPPLGMFDFSPLVLLLLIQLVSNLLIRFLYTLA